MKLLEYHKDITNYVLTIYIYQSVIKPFNDKLTKINLKERIKITTLMLIFGTIGILTNMFKLIKYEISKINTTA